METAGQLMQTLKGPLVELSVTTENLPMHPTSPAIRPGPSAVFKGILGDEDAFIKKGGEGEWLLNSSSED